MIINQLSGSGSTRATDPTLTDGEQSEHESSSVTAIYAKPAIEQEYSAKVLRSIISNQREKVDQMQTKTLRHCVENATT